ncbi:GNAT family N-acetyltransferase [Actinosynnema pretiosum subsp. pretiosum]|uniref:GNAT family N-acetyltransferase n=2 Tax=Actinosynnema TaxID=40566 RepID=A0AA45L570_9PSEU|nr:GNAT family N-acetyltransferase [Actinosynnema pretiosum subsp. pretiosum]
MSLHPASTDEDYELLAAWASSTTSVYSSGQVRPVTPAQLREAGELHGMRYLVVRDREGEPVGGVNWRPVTYEGHFEVGNAVGPPQLWDLGYGVESVLLLLEELFHQRNAHRVHLMTAAFNKRMVQIFTSGLIHVEGVLRDYFYLDGAYHHAVIGSILRDEYYRHAGLDAVRRMDLVPRRDKEEAVELLTAHLAAHPVVAGRGTSATPAQTGPPREGVAWIDPLRTDPPPTAADPALAAFSRRTNGEGA